MTDYPTPEQRHAAAKALRDVAAELNRANSGWRGVLNAAARYAPAVSAQWLEARAERIEQEPDTDTRCTHQDAAGQCLDHQGHQGDHQYPSPKRWRTYNGPMPHTAPSRWEPPPLSVSEGR